MICRVRHILIFFFLFGVFTTFGVELVSAQSLKVEMVNNQPFPVRMPIALKAEDLKGDSFGTSNGKSAQKNGDDLVFISDIAASSRQEFNLQKGLVSRRMNGLLVLEPSVDGVALKFAGVDLGRLSWQIVYRDSKPEELKGVPFSTKEDFSAQFQPNSIKFDKITEGAVFDDWSGTAEKSGLRLTIELRIFHDGFLDIKSELKNLAAAKTENVYAAVITRWQQSVSVGRSVCYDNRISALKENDWTNFRVGESRNWYVQRGVDWLNTNFKGNVSAAWLNDFSESFTVHQAATAKHPARWVGANIPQIGFEAQTKNTDLYILTEIARSHE